MNFLKLEKRYFPVYVDMCMSFVNTVQKTLWLLSWGRTWCLRFQTCIWFMCIADVFICIFMPQADTRLCSFYFPSRLTIKITCAALNILQRLLWSFYFATFGTFPLFFFCCLMFSDAVDMSDIQFVDSWELMRLILYCGGFFF